MRNLLLLLALIATTFITPSCNKDDDAGNTTEKRLTARWNFLRADYTDFENGISDSYTETAQTGDYFDFREDGTLHTRVDGDDDSFAWRLEGSNQLYIKDDFDGSETLFEIQTLTANALVLYSRETASADYYEVTAHLSK